MIFSNINEERERKKKWLLDQVNLAIQSTGYILSNFEVHPDIFGNVVIELSKDNQTVRFVQDRETYIWTKKRNNSKTWADQQLMFNHSETTADSYDTLIKAIEQL